MESGEVRWTRDFSEYGSGGDDAGMCLMDGTLYYSCYFGGKGPQGVTAAIVPETGRVLWSTTDYALHAGCTVSGGDGRIYLGGYNPVEGKINRVWCLDARDGSLVWKSDPLSRAIHVVTIGERFLFPARRSAGLHRRHRLQRPPLSHDQRKRAAVFGSLRRGGRRAPCLVGPIAADQTTWIARGVLAHGISPPERDGGRHRHEE